MSAYGPQLTFVATRSMSATDPKQTSGERGEIVAIERAPCAYCDCFRGRSARLLTPPATLTAVSIGKSRSHGRASRRLDTTGGIPWNSVGAISVQLSRNRLKLLLPRNTLRGAIQPISH